MDENQFKCTFDKNHPEIKTQHLYVCKTCKFNRFETICESCAKLCHSGHELIDLHYTRGYCRCGQGTSACYCFCQNPVPNMLSIPLNKNRQCDFLTYKKRMHDLDVCQCTTCDMGGSACMCIPCGLICHFNHEIQTHHSSSAYCDCGDPSQPNWHRHCKISNPENNEPIPVCSFLLSKNPIKQKKFFCNSCDSQHLNPICEFCIKICHTGHKVEEVDEDGNSSFVCSCGSRLLDCKCNILSKIEPAS